MIDWTKYPHLNPAAVHIETYTPAVPRAREHVTTRVCEVMTGIVEHGSGADGLVFALKRLDAKVARRRTPDVGLSSTATT